MDFSSVVSASLVVDFSSVVSHLCSEISAVVPTLCSVVFAVTDARNKFIADGDGADDGEEKEFDDISGKSSGDSQGYSYNLSWTMPMRGNLLFRTRLRVNRYKQDIHFQGQTFSDIIESSSMLLVGVTRVF